MKKLTISKLLLLTMVLLSIAVVIFSCVIMVYQQVYDPLCYLIPAVFTECAAATGFYYNKAKHENKIKIVLGAINEIGTTGENLTENEVRIIESLSNILND